MPNFIARACNSHEGLLAACEAMIGVVEWTGDHGANQAANQSILKFARAAIAKAEGTA